jgi:hypothetical protein
MAKMTRKEFLNAPDEFVTTTSTVLKWIKENPLRLAIITVIAVTLITSGFGFTYWKSKRENHAMLAYNTAYNNSQMSLQVMQDYADTKAGKLSKLRLASLSYGQKDYAMTLNYANDFINGWGQEDLFYWQGILIIASSNIEQNTTENALPPLSDCIKNAPENIRDQALFYNAQALMKLDRRDEARESLVKISQNYQDLAKISLAMLEKHPGETTDAKQ